MRVIGIDPGLVATGFGVVEDFSSGRLSYVASGSISTSSKDPLPKRLNKIYNEIIILLQLHRPDMVVVEDTFMARNVQSALKLGQARGLALLAAEQSGLSAEEYSPTQIKSSVAGYGAASKEQVRQMVLRILNHTPLPDHLLSHHAADALACAICHLHMAKMKMVMAGKL